MTNAATNRVCADDLQIAGFVPLSTVDWPGKLAASVFCQGCPWACAYCHNHAIIDCSLPGVVAWSQVEELLKRRRGLLDAIVFSGGEALRQAAVEPAAAIAKDLGFAVGVHTAGPYPRALKRLIDAKLVDWVGLDIKATSHNYPQVVGRPHSGPKAWQCLDIVVESGISSEVRLTVYPDGPRDARDVAAACLDKGVEVFALQQARGQGAPSGFCAAREGWDDYVRVLAEDIGRMGFRTFIFRPA